jgi:hypothetical protein
MPFHEKKKEEKKKEERRGYLANFKQLLIVYNECHKTTI